MKMKNMPLQLLSILGLFEENFSSTSAILNGLEKEFNYLLQTKHLQKKLIVSKSNNIMIPSGINCRFF
jgi:hypothetical protein